MKAVIYARYSSDSPREEFIERQFRECTEYAESKGITVLCSYIDRALSARTADRPAFQNMIKDSEQKLFDDRLVITYNFKGDTETINLKDIETAYGSDLKAMSPVGREAGTRPPEPSTGQGLSGTTRSSGNSFRVICRRSLRPGLFPAFPRSIIIASITEFPNSSFHVHSPSLPSPAPSPGTGRAGLVSSL